MVVACSNRIKPRKPSPNYERPSNSTPPMHKVGSFSHAPIKKRATPPAPRRRSRITKNTNDLRFQISDLLTEPDFVGMLIRKDLLRGFAARCAERLPLSARFPFFFGLRPPLSGRSSNGGGMHFRKVEDF